MECPFHIIDSWHIIESIHNIAELFTISGLVIAYYGGLKPGGTIVLMGVVCLIGILIVKSAVERRQAKKA